MTNHATSEALPVAREDLAAAKRLRAEIVRQLGPRRGLGKIEHHDFDVQLLAAHRLTAVDEIQRRAGQAARSPSVIEATSNAYADAWSADIAAYLGGTVPDWHDMGQNQRAAMTRVAAEVLPLMVEAICKPCRENQATPLDEADAKVADGASARKGGILTWIGKGQE